MPEKQKCWDTLKCEEEECPAFGSEALACWLVPGTRCGGGLQGAFVEKIDMCLACEVLIKNLDRDAWAETLKALNERFTAIKRMLEDRDRELESLSMELTLGLSEVFNALTRISSGDTLVRIPETSEIEFVAELKRKVNLTAENLSEIIDLSHEIAVGLAEHFDVLDRVTKGDLTARVEGHSHVELIEALKTKANQMIESVSREIVERKRAEEALNEAHGELETRVQERTAELKAANALLKQEIDARMRLVEVLRETEARYHSVVQDQTELICRFTPEGRLTFVNNAYCRFFAKNAEELVGHELAICIRDENKQPMASSSSYANPEQVLELQVERSDKEARWQQWNIRAVHNEQGKPAEFQAVGRDITDRKRAEERLLVYHNRLRSLASSLSLAEQQERRRIATEVHDHIGQNLAFAKIKLGTLRSSAISEEPKKEIQHVIELVDEAIKDTRSLVSELGSPILYELGFVPAVEWLSQQMGNRHDIVLSFEDDGKPKPLNDDVRVLLFQAVRELLANVVRHSKAETAEVFILRSGDEICVHVNDDGVGFDPSQISPSLDQTGRFGLFSIRERLEPLGGQVQMASSPGKGTKVTLTAPLSPERQEDRIENP